MAGDGVEHVPWPAVPERGPPLLRSQRGRASRDPLVMRVCRSGNRIIMLHQGRVLAEGTQGELLSSCPEYRALWDASEQVSGWTLRGGGRIDAQGAGGREALSC